MFVVRFLCQFLGRDVSCGYCRVSVAALFENLNWQISSHLSLKLVLSLQRGHSLRN